MSEFDKNVPTEAASPESPCSKCGTTEQDDILHCDEFGPELVALRKTAEEK